MHRNITFPETINNFLTWVKITADAARSKTSEDVFFMVSNGCRLVNMRSAEKAVSIKLRTVAFAEFNWL